MGVGAVNKAGDFFALFIAVGGHKVFDGFALGVPVFYSPLAMREKVAALLFASLMTPMGVLIGMASSDASSGVRLCARKLDRGDPSAASQCDFSVLQARRHCY